MAIVEFMGPIHLQAREFDVGSLAELREKLGEIPEVVEWLEISAIAVNDVIASDIAQKLGPKDRVVILPPVCGG